MNVSTGTRTVATAGVALAAAGAVALTPINPPLMPHVKTGHSEVALSALAGGFFGTFDYALNTGGAARVNTTPPALDALDIPVYLAANLAASGVRGLQALAMAPMGLVSTFAAAVTGDWETVAGNLINFIDGPLWVADPTLFALRDVLPAPLGGSDGLVWGIREGIRSAGLALESALLPLLPDPQNSLVAAQLAQPGSITSIGDFFDAVQYAVETGGGVRVNDPQPATDPIQSLAFLGAGLAASGIRGVEALAMAPMGVAQLAYYALTGQEALASATLKNLIDGPLWVADPTLFALRDVTPAPIGGTSGVVMQGREVVRQAGNGLETGTAAALGWPNPNPMTTSLKVSSGASLKTSETSSPKTSTPIVKAPKAGSTTPKQQGSLLGNLFELKVQSSTKHPAKEPKADVTVTADSTPGAPK